MRLPMSGIRRAYAVWTYHGSSLVLFKTISSIHQAAKGPSNAHTESEYARTYEEESLQGILAVLDLLTSAACRTTLTDYVEKI